LSRRRSPRLESTGESTIAEDHNSVSPGLAALVARAERAGKGAPPVEKWNPDFCGVSEMVIRADGSWTYQGSPIGRPALVRLFSSVLRRDADGQTFLVTPLEKLSIAVEDAPFIAVEMSRDAAEAGPVLSFRTNVGDLVAAGPANPLRFAVDEAGGFTPYVLVRGRLEAKLTRALAFDLVDFVEVLVDGSSVVRSGGTSFALPAGMGEGA
jgi:hypothetical protein